MAGVLGPGYSNLIVAVSAQDAARRLEAVVGSCEIRPLQDRSPFSMNFDWISFEAASFLTWNFASEVIVSAQFEQYLICAAIDGRITFEDNDRVVVIEGKSASIIPPSRSGRFHWSAGATLVGVTIHEHDFRRGALAGLASSGVVQFGLCREFDLSTYPGTLFSELIEFLRTDGKNRKSSKDNKAVRFLFERMIIFSLLRLFEDDFVVHRLGVDQVLVPKHVKLAEDYIKAHLAEPLDNRILANVADVSPRSLHRGFVQFRGVTPGRYIQDLRLDSAHRVLTEKRGARDIREIASSLGFTSYTAFWRSYVRRFGIAPSKVRAGRSSVA